MNTRMFKHHMGAMKVHFSSGSTESFSLPNAVLFADFQFQSLLVPTRAAAVLAVGQSRELIGGIMLDPGSSPSALEKVAATIKRKMSLFVDDAASSAQVEVDKLNAISNPTETDTNAFIKKMNEKRKEAKKASNKIIDEGYDALIAAGEDNPEQQSKIMRIASSLGSFFTVLFGKVVEFFRDIYEDIKQFITDAVKWVKDAGGKVVSLVKDAGNAIDRFLDSIF